MRGKSAYSALANWLARQRPTMTGWASKTLPLQIAKVRRCHACLQQCEGACGALGTLSLSLLLGRRHGASHLTQPRLAVLPI